MQVSKAKKELGFSTKAVHLPYDRLSFPDAESSRAAVDPVFQTSVYEFDTLDALEDFNKGVGSKYWYGRYGLPNQELLGNAVAELEGFDKGLVCASGMSAITSVILGLGSKESKIVAISDIYGGTYSVLKSDLPRFGIEVLFADSVNTRELGAQLERNNRGDAMVLIETETNPSLKIPDISAISEVCKRFDATLVVDNTFATPYNCQPRKLGADVVVHSATKFLGGHDDLTLGIVVADTARLTKIKEFAIRTGLTSPSPWEAWLCLRSLRTLGLRMKRANENAAILAEFLATKREISRVIYPGLRTHPQYELAKRIFSNGGGALLSFELRGGYETVRNLISKLKVVKLIPSLGSIKTSISYPPLTSHRSVPKATREAMGITDGFLRVSVGVEDPEDLLEDFQQGLS